MLRRSAPGVKSASEAAGKHVALPRRARSGILVDRLRPAAGVRRHAEPRRNRHRRALVVLVVRQTATTSPSPSQRSSSSGSGSIRTTPSSPRTACAD